jgi:hypothetical protein
MGSGYNDSLAVSRGARGRAETRSPIHFYLSVPVYQYDLHCGTSERVHLFRSRTPVVAPDFHDDDGNELPSIVWCEYCQMYREIALDAEPLNQPVTNDEKIAFEQDKGIMRERIAMVIQDMGYLDNDTEIMELAIQFGVPVSEIKKMNAGLKAPEGLSGQPDMCAAGLHEMTVDNMKIVNGRRTCLACYREKDRQAKQRKREKARLVRSTALS